MNKGELIEAVAEAASLSKTDAGNAVEAFMSVVSARLKRGESVTLVGFGTFEVSHRPARPGRNPRTGETIQIAARNVPKFKPGKGLKDAVN